MRRGALARIAWITCLGACSGSPAGTDWAQVRRDDLVLSVEVTGTLEALDAAILTPPQVGDRWDYKIARMAPEGEEVEQGDVVLGFDASELGNELEKMRNEEDAAAKQIASVQATSAMVRKEEDLAIATAEATLRKASIKGDRPGDLSSSIELRTLAFDRQLAELELEHMRQKATDTRRHDAVELQRVREQHAFAASRVRELEDSITQMVVRAPRAGTVIYSTNWRGEKKKVGDGAWRMEKILEIASLEQMIGKGTIDEVDAARVVVGQRVTFRLDAHPEKEVVGKITALANAMRAASPSDPSRVIELTLAIEDAGELPLRPGMRFRGAVETERVPDVVIVPADAVFVTPTGPVAYRRQGGGHVRTALELGRRTTTEIEVKTGLAPGDLASRMDLGR